MLRRTAAALTTCVAVAGLAAPAAAAPSPRVDIVVGYENGELAVRSVPAPSVAATVERLEADPAIAFAERDVPVRAAATGDRDPLYRYQWGPPAVRANEVWPKATGGQGAVVAVIDSGVDDEHPDLAGAVLPGLDLVGDGRTGDPNGHGTAVAGVVAARGDNGVGVAGYCWTCTILPVRVLDRTGAGSSSAVASGIMWAADHGAQIINLSLAAEQPSQAMDSAVAYARAKGIVVVAAAGNAGSTRPTYPAASPGVLGVVATTVDDEPYEWATRGPWASVGAPGCAVTTVPGSYDEECGSSMAAPAVAGAIGLAMAAVPGTTQGAAEDALLRSAVPMAPGTTARGRVDVAALVTALATIAPPRRSSNRVAGSDRVATSVLLSERVRDSAGAVVLARADSYADALSAAPLAGRLDAPVLLTAGHRLSPAVTAEIRRLGATTIWLVGGPAALGDGVEAGARAAGATEVRRIAGRSRFDTARLIGRVVGGTSAVIARSDAWPDAVAASSLAAQRQSPILLVGRDGVPAATMEALAQIGITEVTAVGGPATIPEHLLDVVRSTGVEVTRVAGPDRYATSAAIAGLAVAHGADASHVWLATGTDWPDALAAGPAAAADGGVLLLVDGRNPARSAATASWLRASAAPLDRAVIVGGDSVISAEALVQLAGLTG